MKARSYVLIQVAAFAAFILSVYISLETVWWVSPVFAVLAFLTLLEIARCLRAGFGSDGIAELNSASKHRG